MEILFITGNLPYPPTDGWKIRVFSLIRNLSQRHRVSLISFMRTTEDSQAIEALRAYCADVWVLPRDPRYSPWMLLLGLVGPTAFPVVNYRDQRMTDLLREILTKRSFDVVQAESLHVAQYCLGLPCHTVLDLHNIESLLMKRYAEQERHPLKRAYAEVTWRKLAAYERDVCGRFTHCLTCSEEDRRLLQEQAGVERVSVIPNGVDVDGFAPDGVGTIPSNRLVFVGRMDYHANVDGVRWFCAEVLPLVQAKRPDVVFQIVGGHPTEEVKRLTRPGRVDVTGFVEDVRPFLQAAAVVVVPLRVGGGTRLKILEAMAMGKAVVSTAVGAEGIAAVSGQDILMADRPREFADDILRLLENPDLRRRMGMAGRRLVEAHYKWECIAQRLERVYEECTHVYSRPSVLALIATGAVSGPCRGLFQLVEHAKDKDVRFILGMFLVPSFATTPSIEEAQRRGFEVRILPQRFRYDPWLIRHVWKVVRDHNVTVLQSHGYKPALLAWCLKRLTGLPWIAFAHGYTSENRRVAFYNHLDLWLMKRADRVVVVSEATGRLLQRAGVSRERIRVSYNAIDPNDYCLDAGREEFRRRCGVQPHDLLVGVIGRLSPEKGQEVFVRAFPEVARAVPNAGAVLIGEGQELEKLQAAVKAAGLEGCVKFAGYHAEMSRVYAALDLVVIPSLSEGLPNVLLEAMLHRKPVVATAVGGIPEVMQDGLSKWLVPPGNAQALARAMIEASRNPTMRAELGELGERRVRETFSPSRRAQQIVEVYKELLDTYRG